MYLKTLMPLDDIVMKTPGMTIIVLEIEFEATVGSKDKIFLSELLKTKELVISKSGSPIHNLPSLKT